MAKQLTPQSKESAVSPLQIAVIYDAPRTHTICGQRTVKDGIVSHDYKHTFVPGLNVIPSKLWEGLKPHAAHLIDSNELREAGEAIKIDGAFLGDRDEPQAIRCASSVMDVELLNDFRRAEVNRGRGKRQRVLDAIDKQTQELQRTSN